MQAFIDNNIVKEWAEDRIVKDGRSIGILAETVRWKMKAVGFIEVDMEG